MFLRKKRVSQGGRSYEYLLLVETVRRGRKVRQRTICNFGRVDQVDPRQVDAVIRGLSVFAQDSLVLDLTDSQGAVRDCRILGPLPLLSRLWEDLGIGPFLRKVSQESDMPLETAAFAMVASRFLHPDSKRGTFLHDLSRYAWPRFGSLSLHHLYLALDLLAENHAALEQVVWKNARDLLRPTVDLVLADTTNTYFHGTTRGSLAQFGKSKERRYDRRLVSLGLLVTRDGIPIGQEVFPGNTHDAVAFRQMLEVLRGRFSLGRVLLCADRGMVSDEILRSLRETGTPYVAGSRMTERAEAALSYTGARWQEIEDLGLRYKELAIGDETYVVVHSPKEEEHDRARREEILERLRRTLAKNPSGSSLLRNTVYRPYLKVMGKVAELDEEAVRQSARYDGKYVLRANTDLSGEEIVRAYRQLFAVERAFRELKGPFELRPIFHWTDRRIRGHLEVCFLAYVLEMVFRRALGRGTVAPEGVYRETLRELERVTTVTLVSTSGKEYTVRTPIEGEAYTAYQALGIKPPPRVLGEEDLKHRVGRWRRGLGSGLRCPGLSVPRVSHSSAMPGLHRPL
jgi:hypothetical protein